MDLAGLISTVESAAATIKLAFNDAVIIGRAIPGIHSDIKAGKSLVSIAADLEPEALAIVEQIANVVFPGAGSVIGVLAYIVSKSHPMTAEEEQAWFDREDGTIRDSTGNKADGW